MEAELLGLLNILKKLPPVEFAKTFPCWNRNGAPWPSGVLGCHLCNATCAEGVFMSTTTTESEDACMAEAGRLHRSGFGTTYDLTSFGFLKIV